MLPREFIYFFKHDVLKTAPLSFMKNFAYQFNFIIKVPYIIFIFISIVQTCETNDLSNSIIIIALKVTLINITLMRANYLNI